MPDNNIVRFDTCRRKSITINAPSYVLPGIFWEWLLIPLIIGLMTLSHFVGLSRIMVLYGLAFSWLFSICFLYNRLKLQSEVIIYFVWILWSLCGLCNVANQTLYFDQLITIIQIGVLVFLVAGIIGFRRNLHKLMLAITVGGLIVALCSYLSGEFQIVGETASNMRSAGMTGNANSFAYHLLFVIFTVFYFLESKYSIWLRVLLPAVATICVIGIISSGSRKGFLGLLAFVLLWFLFCQGKRVLKRPIVTLTIFLILSGGIYYVTGYVLSNTLLGKRFDHKQVERGGGDRWELYTDGFNMIKKNPIYGVGLNNYMVLSHRHVYSHSDYIEVAASTGVVGFILYYSIYVVLWRRLCRIKSMTNDSRLLRKIGLFKAMIITILLIAFGRVNITSKLTWVLLAGIIGYSWAVERTLATETLFKNESHRSGDVPD